MRVEHVHAAAHHDGGVEHAVAAVHHVVVDRHRHKGGMRRDATESAGVEGLEVGVRVHVHAVEHTTECLHGVARLVEHAVLALLHTSPAHTAVQSRGAWPLLQALLQRATGVADRAYAPVPVWWYTKMVPL